MWMDLVERILCAGEVDEKGAAYLEEVVLVYSDTCC